MSPIVIKMFASQVMGVASAPGTGSKQVTLGATKAPNSAIVGPNDALFAAPDGQINLTGTKLSAAIAQGFVEGKSYTVTIAEDPTPDPAS